MNNFRDNLREKLSKYIKLNYLTCTSFRNEGLNNMGYTIRRGSTKFNTLFDASIFLNIDIRNLLMFDSNTYVFRNSFDSFEEFFIFISKRFKEFRLQKGLRAIDVDKYLDTVYRFESCKELVSLRKFYEYLDKLGITVDEFFLKDEEYEIINKPSKRIDSKIECTIESIFNRVDELEKMRGVKIAKSVIPTRTVIPTVHVFLNICKSLKVSPSDFFDFAKREDEDFNHYKCKIDNRIIIGNIRKIIKADGENAQKFLRIDNIINFCNNKNIDIKKLLEPRFLEGLEEDGNLFLECGIIMEKEQ